MTASTCCDAALLTAPGRGAIAVVRLRGPDALAVADAVFRPARGKALRDTPADRPRLGRVGDGLGDEVVAVVVATDPPEVEFQGHAGPAAVGMVMDALRRQGARIVTAEDWVRSATASPLAADALVDLAHAPTVRSAEILLEQAGGALEREFCAIRDALPDRIDDALAHLDRLRQRAEVGLRLIAGWRVVLAGRPNVGKSRLLNALAGYERAIVHATPGTTRDVVTVTTAVEGWPVEIADTAGLRRTDDPIELQGLELARERASRADLVLLLLDRSEPLRADDLDALDALPEALRVASKADLPPRWEAGELGALPLSAETSIGLDDLLAAIGRRLVPAPPEPGAGVPFRREHIQAIETIRESLLAGRIEEAKACLAAIVPGLPSGAGD